MKQIKLPPARTLWLLAIVLLVGLVGFIAGILASGPGGLGLRSLVGALTRSEDDLAVEQMLSAVETDTARNAAELEGFVAAAENQPSGGSLHFYGNGQDGIDRVLLPISGDGSPLDIGEGDFTIEFWMKTIFGENGDYICSNKPDDWIYGDIIFDRDTPGDDDNQPRQGDYGVSLTNGRIAFGTHNGVSGATLCGKTFVDDNRWHHIALTRSASTGDLRLFVDGIPDGLVSGPKGNISSQFDPESILPQSAFLVLGAEKHDSGPIYPSYSGWIDEIRISSGILYSAPFARPEAPFSDLPSTLGLYHLDEGMGGVIRDASAAENGPVDGWCVHGGSPAGPEWWNDTPFNPPLRPRPLGPCSGEENLYLPVIIQDEMTE